MDSLELNKIVGALCGALLFLMLLSWAGETIYHVGGDGHEGDHGEEVVAGYPIAVEMAEASDEPEEAAPPMAELLLAADVAKGENVFKKCKSCHKLENGANGTGPHLFGIVDRPVGSVADFGYSGAMADHGGTWDVESLSAFLANPKDYMKGTKMSFKGLSKATERADVIAYLQSIN